MKVGDYVNPLISGNKAIDVKGMMKDAGYITGQGSIDSLKQIPVEVDTEIKRIQKDQEDIERLSEIARFTCPACGEINVSNWRKDKDGEFLICGACDKVTEVR